MLLDMSRPSVRALVDEYCELQLRIHESTEELDETFAAYRAAQEMHTKLTSKQHNIVLALSHLSGLPCSIVENEIKRQTEGIAALGQPKQVRRAKARVGGVRRGTPSLVAEDVED